VSQLPTLPEARLQRCISLQQGVNRPQVQAIAIQDLLFLTLNSPDSSPSARASLARSWCMIQDTKRVQKGRPLPGHLRPEARPSKRKPNGSHHQVNPVALGPPTAEDRRLDEEREREAAEQQPESPVNTQQLGQ